MNSESKKIIAAVFVALFFIALQSVPGALLRTASADLWSDQVDIGGIDVIGGQAFNATDEPTDIRVIIGRVIRVFLGLLGIVFVVLIVLAGYKWMSAAGDSGKVDEAKDQLQTGAIGLLIVLAAYGVTIFVFRAILIATNTNPSPSL